MPKRRSDRREERPYCRKCGRFLVGGKDGYCPNKHYWENKQDLIKECKKILSGYTNSECPEIEKIKQQIKNLKDKYGSQDN